MNKKTNPRIPIQKIIKNRKSTQFFNLGNLFKNVHFKQYFIWPLFIALIIFLANLVFSIYSDRANKKHLMREKQLTIISDLTQSFEVYSYYSGFRGMIEIEKMEYVKYFAEIKNETLQKVFLPIKDRIRLSDTLKQIYPFVYEKMIEGDLRANEFLKNIHLGQLLFNDSIRIRLNNFLDYVPIDKKINEYVSYRLKTDSSKISELEKNNILDSIRVRSAKEISSILDAMIKEIRQ